MEISMRRKLMPLFTNPCEFMDGAVKRVCATKRRRRGSMAFAVKRPILGGACPWCPWGALADKVKEAMKPYGYDVQICYNCSAIDSVRIVAERRKPLPLPPQYSRAVSGAAQRRGRLWNSESGFLRGWLSRRGACTSRTGHAPNLRLIAKIEDPQYYMAATRREAFITDLSQIKEKKLPAHILTDNSIRAQMILDYYGITREELASWGGGFVSGEPGNRENFDVILWFVNSLNNTPESNVWYELSQKANLLYLQLPDDLLEKMAAGHRVGGGQHASATAARNGQAGQDDSLLGYGNLRAGRPARTVRLRRGEGAGRTEAGAGLQHICPSPTIRPTVWQARGVPLHPGAAQYYQEKGYMPKTGN